MKPKETLIKEAFADIMYSKKSVNEVLEEVYEEAFSNGFKQGNDNAKEVIDFENKKSDS